MQRIVIVGGGITGLAAAYFLEKDFDFDIALLEVADAVGGKIRTVREGGFLMEEGPDCFYSRKAEALDLVLQLGLENWLVEPRQRQFMMLVDGALHPVSAAVTSFMYADRKVIDQLDFVSERGRERAKKEGEQPVGVGEDESIASFFRRRFGDEFSKKLVEPLLAGTHSGKANELSLRALYPSFMDAERRAGSLSAAVANATSNSSEGKAHEGAFFLSFQNGMGGLIEGLQSSLKHTTISTRVRPVAITSEGVQTGNGFERADLILAATPSNVTAKLVGSSNPHLAKALAAIPFSSVRILTAGFKKSQMSGSLENTGFLVPESEPAHITGCTFASEKWPNRAPSDSVLLRIFLRAGSTVQQGLEQVCALLGISGQPTVAHETCWTNGLPQYQVGHLERLAEIDRCLTPGLFLAGTSYRGVGVPDCIRQGKEAATRIAEQLALT